MKRKTVDIYFMICSGNVDWTWREQADLVKWTRVSVSPNFYSSNVPHNERDRDIIHVHEINVFLQIKHNGFTFFNLVPNSSIFTETTAT